MFKDRISYLQAIETSWGKYEQKEKFVLLSGFFSNVCQPSVLCRCVTLVVRQWSLTANRASLQCVFSQGVGDRT